ncbi:MAG: hypothetical protein M3Q97_01130 [Bacteroidota bacterium]|nr:hypothetical protein [Bacteroidota bacterium]
MKKVFFLFAFVTLLISNVTSLYADIKIESYFIGVEHPNNNPEIYCYKYFVVVYSEDAEHGKIYIAHKNIVICAESYYTDGPDDELGTEFDSRMANDPTFAALVNNKIQELRIIHFGSGKTNTNEGKSMEPSQEENTPKLDSKSAIQVNSFEGNIEIYINYAFFSTTSDVSFILMDVTGKQVRNIKLPDTMEVVEKGNLPSGVYFYYISADGALIDSGKATLY